MQASGRREHHGHRDGRRENGHGDRGRRCVDGHGHERKSAEERRVDGDGLRLGGEQVRGGDNQGGRPGLAGRGQPVQPAVQHHQPDAGHGQRVPGQRRRHGGRPAQQRAHRGRDHRRREQVRHRSV